MQPMILQQLSGSRILSPKIQAMLPQINQLKQAVRMMNNPQEIINQAVAQNPQFAQLMSMANGDYNKAFYGLCSQMSIDPNEFMEALK